MFLFQLMYGFISFRICDVRGVGIVPNVNNVKSWRVRTLVFSFLRVLSKLFFSRFLSQNRPITNTSKFPFYSLLVMNFDSFLNIFFFR